VSYEQVEQANAAALRQVAQVTQGTQSFLQAAQTGGFGVSPEAGKAMLDAIHQCQDGLDAANEDVRRITQRTMLGTSPDATVISDFNMEVADGADNSATAYLTKLREALSELEAGINEAMKHYRRADEDSAGGVSRAGA
jgi:hypothetical protein